MLASPRRPNATMGILASRSCTSSEDDHTSLSGHVMAPVLALRPILYISMLFVAAAPEFHGIMSAENAPTGGGKPW